MKKLSRFIIAFILTTISILPALAEGYTALVLPNSCVAPKNINKIDNTDIEKLLARKIIDKLENSGMDYAPTLNVLRISIINNSNFDSNTKEPMNNVRAIAKAYGISKVILVSSKTEIQSVSKQKEFWEKMNLPVLTQPEANIKVTTTVKLYNSKTDEIVYSDVFYKKLNIIGNDINNEQKKLSAINSYYDELLPKLFDEIKDSKETHAVRVISNADLTEVKNSGATPVLMYKPITKEKTMNNTVAKKIKPDLTVKKNVTDKQKVSFISKMKDSFKLKYTNTKSKIVNNSSVKNEKTKPYVVKKSVINKISKENRLVKKTETKSKIVSTKQYKEKKSDNIIKLKYNDMKSKYIVNKAEKIKNKENVKYSAVVIPNEENTANRYIQTRPRANAKGYTPHFENEVNDI